MNHLTQLRNLVKELLEWDDYAAEVVDIVSASYLANFLTGSIERPWLALVGPPACGKSEMLKIFEPYPQSVKRDKITANAFASAYRDEKNPEDVSLVHQLSYNYAGNGAQKGNKVLIIPEISSIYNMNPNLTNEFVSDLRAAYDNSFNVHAGNVGEIKSGFLGFGVMMGGTYIMDLHQKANQAIGSRTLICRMGSRNVGILASAKEARRANEHDSLAKEALTKRIQNVAAVMLTEARLRIGKGMVRASMTDEQARRLELMASIGVNIRTVPPGPVTYSPKPEGPGRLTRQIRAWGNAHAILDGRSEWNAHDMHLTTRLLRDTMPPDLLRLFGALWQDGPREAKNALSVPFIARKARMSQDTAFRQLTQWSMLNMAVEDADRTYRLHQDVVDAVVMTEFMEGVTYE